MELLALAALLIGFLASLYALDRRDRREREERAELLTRIQAPERVIYGDDELETQILGVEFDNDQEFAEMRRESATE
jgi:hypothetical protein